MPNGGLQLDPSGTVKRIESPKAIEARGRARESYARVVVAGIILVVLALTYAISFILNLQPPNEMLVLVGTGLGYLIGNSPRPTAE